MGRCFFLPDDEVGSSWFRPGWSHGGPHELLTSSPTSRSIWSSDQDHKLHVVVRLASKCCWTRLTPSTGLTRSGPSGHHKPCTPHISTSPLGILSGLSFRPGGLEGTYRIILVGDFFSSCLVIFLFLFFWFGLVWFGWVWLMLSRGSSYCLKANWNRQMNNHHHHHHHHDLVNSSSWSDERFDPLNITEESH